MDSGVLAPGAAETLWVSSKTRKRRTGLTAGTVLPADVAALLGKAELHYINGEIEQSIVILSEVTRKAPRLPTPYNILALIYEESSDYLRALQLYAVSATLTPKSLELWTKVANMAGMLGEYEQAIAATNRCIKLLPGPDMYEQKITLLIRSRQLKKARESLRAFFVKFPERVTFMIHFGDEMADIGIHDTAVSSYLKYVFHWFGTSSVEGEDLASLVNFVSERKSPNLINENINQIFYAVRRAVDILLHKSDGLLPSIELLNLCADFIQVISAYSFETPQFPLEVGILFGICKLRFRSEPDIDAGLIILNPILKAIETSDAIGIVRNTNHNQSVAGDTSDSSDDDEFVSLPVPGDVSVLQRRHADDHSAGTTTSLTVTTEELELMYFMLRQRVRVAEEFAGIGMVTRADKLLSSITDRLREMKSHPLKVINGNDESYSNNTTNALGSMWRDVGNVYCVLSKEEHAYSAYKAAMDYNDHDIEALSKYAEITRIHFPDNSSTVMTMLGTHFLGLMQEFEMFRIQQLSNAQVSKSAKTRSQQTPTQAIPPVSSGDVDNGQANEIDSSNPFFIHCMQGGLDFDFIDSMSVDNLDLGEEDFADIDLLPTSMRLPAVSDHQDSPLVDENDDADEQTIGDRHRRGSSSNTNQMLQYFTRSNLQHEIFALVEWTYLFIDDADPDVQSYCSITIPLLEHWCFTCTAAASTSDGTVQKRRNKAKAVISILDLVATSTCVHYHPKTWFDETNNICARVVSSLCDYVNIEKLLGKELLQEMCTKTVSAMIAVGRNLDMSGGNVNTSTNLTMLTALGNELSHCCSLMVVRRGNNNPRWRRGVAGTTMENVNDNDQLLLNEQLDENGNENSSGEDSDYDQEDVLDNKEAFAGSKVISSKMKRMSTRKRKVLTLAAFRRRRKKIKVNNTGVNGGLMFNDFKTASFLENADPFIVAAGLFSPAVQNAASALFNTPGDIAKANHLFRLLIDESSMFESSTASKFMENILPLGRLYNVKYDSVVTCLLSGHEMSKQKKNNEALCKYLNAFCIDPKQPLVLLCIATYLITLGNHSHIKHRQEVLLKGFMFLHRYFAVRQEQEVPVFQQECLAAEHLSLAGLQQEALYNLGRALQEIKLNHLAAEQYVAALRLVDDHPSLKRTSLNVTTAAAHNLVLIYRHAHAGDLALEVMRKYLSFD